MISRGVCFRVLKPHDDILKYYFPALIEKKVNNLLMLQCFNYLAQLNE